MGPTAPPQVVYRDAPQQQQPTRADPAIEKAKQDELARQQRERGRAATLIVGDPAVGEALLPAGPGAGKAMLGAG